MEDVRLEYRLLGPLEVRDGERQVAIPAGKPRSLLAALLLHAGDVVSIDALVDALWGSTPPATAANALQGYVGQLRRLLGRDAIQTRPPGYLLVLGERDVLDLRDLADLMSRGPEAARQALALFRGEPLVDFRYETFAQAEIGRLEEANAAMLEHRIDADLADARHAELVGELEALIQQHPLREHLRAQLMLALYRSGRQAEALGAYAEARSALVDGLGIDPGPALQSLHHSILNQDPSIAIEARAAPYVTNLPVQANRLIGRQEELDEITRRLREGETRLLTLTGPGGTGKTRLALQAAADLSGAFEGGVYFVPLAPVHDTALVLPTIAKSLGLREQAGQTVLELLSEHLLQRRRLLLLDNFEQVVEAAADVARLLAGAPAVSLLVTSREPLRIGAERCFSVPGLPLPSDGAVDGLENDAVVLFVERARAVREGFELTGDNADEVAAICTLLDGLPLAIELAAARAGVLSPKELVARLDRSLDLLTSGPRDADSRQRTLRATIEWSYDLLNDAEQRAFARLAVFPAGFSLDTAQQVCAAGLDELTGLSEQSLLRREVAGPGFRFLRVIREFAFERLVERGDAKETRQGHASWCLELAHQADAGYRGDDAAMWLTRMESRHDDFRTALGWAQEVGDHELLLDLAVALSAFWQAHGHLTEASAWLDEILDHAADVPEARLLDALSWASTILFRARNHNRVAELAERQLALSRRLGNSRSVVYALSKLASVLSELGEYDQARSLHSEAVAAAKDAGDDRALMVALNNFGNLELANGTKTVAAQLYGDALELARSAGRRDNVAIGLFNVGLAMILADAPAQAAVPLQESVSLSCELGDRESIAYGFEGLAAIAAVGGREREAAVLLGAAAALLESCGASLENVEQALHDRTETQVRSALADEYDIAWREGRDLPLDDLVERIAASAADGAVRIP